VQQDGELCGVAGNHTDLDRASGGRSAVGGARGQRPQAYLAGPRGRRCQRGGQQLAKLTARLV
jgi:hypothetical protein